jgi:hypothetical protein
MITPKITGAIITGIVIVLGVALLYPALRIGNNQDEKQLILLTFNIVNSSNLPTWCDGLSQYLLENNIHSTIFITGIMADTYPTCASGFGEDTDVGSMSYDYTEITSIRSYPDQLNQILKGKQSIDKQGKLNSTVFRAPYGIVDENIYSLLSRSHILADFSYDDHYNVFTDGLSGKTFYWFPSKTLTNLSGLQYSDVNSKMPLMINFYNYDSLKNIAEVVNMTSKYSHRYVSASEITNVRLTSR